MSPTKSEFSSSWGVQAFVKAVPMIFGLILSGIGIVFLVLRINADSTGEPIPLNLKLSLIASGCGLIVVFFLIKNKFGVVKTNPNEIKLERLDRTVNKKWEDVKSVIKLPFCSPPIYRMSFKDDEKPIYFAFRNYFILTTPIFSYDFTGFLPYAKSRLDQIKGN